MIERLTLAAVVAAYLFFAYVFAYNGMAQLAGISCVLATLAGVMAATTTNRRRL